jgi:tRNA threonylcarbamoyladenosine biosynthesis protein TsaE
MPILDPNTFDFISRSPDQTRRIGMRLGELLLPTDVICLNGELGAGKTTLVQGIAKGWGTGDSVTSPTFVLVNNYSRPDGARMNHLDAYRLQNAVEAEDLDLERMIIEGPLLVEWSDRIKAALPDDCLVISMSWVSDEHRRLVFSYQGSRHGKLLEMLKNGMVMSFA